jgi:hypothetical protein
MQYLGPITTGTGALTALGVDAAGTLIKVGNVTTTSSGLMSTIDKTKLDSLPNSFNSALLGSCLAYWDGVADPTLSTNPGVYPVGTKTGSAAFTAGTGMVLTTAINGISGAVGWNFTQMPFMHARFTYLAGGGNGADATWFYCFCDQVPTTEGGGPNTKGYIIGLSEYHGSAVLSWGNNGGGSASWTGTNMTGQLASAAVTGIADNVNHVVDVYISQNRIVLKRDGTTLIDYKDTVIRDLSGTLFGFGARTGGLNNNHIIKNMIVVKNGVNVADFGF